MSEAKEKTGLGALLCTDRAFYKKVATLAFPLIIQQLLMIGVNALNSVMMGRFGEIEMAAVSQATQIYFIFTVAAYGFVSPVGILVAQYWGKRDDENAKTLFGICLRLALIFGAAMTLVVAVFPSQVMRLMTNDASVLAIGTKFMLITSASMLPYCISYAIYCFVRAIGRVRLVFWGNLVCYSVNIILNYLFIFGKAGFPALGALGPAVGTLISRVAECVFLVICLFSKKSALPMRVRDMKRFDRALFGDYIKVMKPIIGHEMIWSFGVSASQIVLGQVSTAATAAYNIAYIFCSFTTSILTGVSATAQIIIGNAIGNGDRQLVKKEARSMLLLATAISLVGMTLMLTLGDAFISLYDVTEETRAYAHSLMPVLAMVAFFSGWEYVGLVGILRAGGDAKTGFFTDIVAMWMIAIPLGVLAAFKWQLSPVLVVLLIKADMPIKATVGAVRVLRMKWINDLTRKSE